MRKYIYLWIPFFILLMDLPQSVTEDTAAPDVTTLNPMSIDPQNVPILKTDNVWHFAYAPDGKRLVCGSVQGRIIVYDTASGQEVARLDGHTGGVRKLAYSPDGRTLACVSSERSVYLWDTETAKPISNITKRNAHPVTVTTVRFSPDGKTLVSESSDGRLFLWRLSAQ